ncbi:MAG: rhomboid family intramembrane serine protease [Nonlabens sp.]
MPLNLDLVTIIIIAVNCVISFKAFQDPGFMEKYLFRIGDIRRGEQFRFITSGFLHVDGRHLGFNMLALYFFAGVVVFNLGAVKFLIIYVASLIAGNLLSYLFHKDEFHYSAVGASGAVSGIIYSAILVEPNMKIYFGIPGYIFGLGYLLYSIYGMKQKRDNIGHDAHFGGAVTGYAITLLYDPTIIVNEPLIVGALLIPIVVLVVMYYSGKL